MGHSMVGDSPCQHHDCKHGICFTPPGSNGYVCKCAPGYSGNHLSKSITCILSLKLITKKMYQFENHNILIPRKEM